METLIALSKHKEQSGASKAIAKAIKVNFKTAWPTYILLYAEIRSNRSRLNFNQ
jgi:hypothetical protein